MDDFSIEGIDELVAPCGDAEEALHALHRRLKPRGVKELFYAYTIHTKARARNEYIAFTTFDDDWEAVFRRTGGTATDIVASRLEYLVTAYPMQLQQVATALRSGGDVRAEYVGWILSQGARTTWVAPFHEQEFQGYGVLNHFHAREDAEPALSPEGLVELAIAFHLALRKYGLLARKVGLAPKQQAVLHDLSMGQTAADIAMRDKVSVRAVEKRVEAARKKLRAANAVEAVYKATAYGVLPIRHRQ